MAPRNSGVRFMQDSCLLRANRVNIHGQKMVQLNNVSRPRRGKNPMIFCGGFPLIWLGFLFFASSSQIVSTIVVIGTGRRSRVGRVRVNIIARPFFAVSQDPRHTFGVPVDNCTVVVHYNSVLGQALNDFRKRHVGSLMIAPCLSSLGRGNRMLRTSFHIVRLFAPRRFRHVGSISQDGWSVCWYTMTRKRPFGRLTLSCLSQVTSGCCLVFSKPRQDDTCPNGFPSSFVLTT